MEENLFPLIETTGPMAVNQIHKKKQSTFNWWLLKQKNTDKWGRQSISITFNWLAVMGQVLPEVRLRRQNLDQSHVLFPIAVGTALFPRAISDHLTLATLILSSLAGWHASGFSGYWHVGSDHNSRGNGVTLLTSSFALWVLCITTFVASGRSNDPAFCDEKSGRCNLASLPFLCFFRNFGHGGARASVIAWPVRIQS